MIQAIKTEALVGEDSKEISFDYDEMEDYVTIYLGDEYICGMCYNDNFKQTQNSTQ